MEEVLPFCSYGGRHIPRWPNFYSKNAPRHSRQPAAVTVAPRRSLGLVLNAPISLPEKPPNFNPVPLLPPPDPAPSTSSFHEKLLFLDSLGVDFFAAAAAYPPLAAVSLSDLRAAVDLLRSLGFASAADLRRVLGMCPEILAADPDDMAAVLTFLLREAGVQGRDLRRVIARRPRLLVSEVAGTLRPTLYFLRMLGVASVARHTSLLSCSVEVKLLPRLEFLEEAGISPRDARRMARRFPQIFCYSIKENLKPKMEFLLSEMKRELSELSDFPQYFSFSLLNRIKPRHLLCLEKGVRLPLPALLKPKDEEFTVRLDVCISSSPPMRRSPLWHESLNCLL